VDDGVVATSVVAGARERKARGPPVHGPRLPAGGRRRRRLTRQHPPGGGRPPQRFARDLEGHHCLPKVRRDFREGVRSGVNGTPTIFINGRRWNGPYTAPALLAGIRGNRSPDVEPMTGLPWGFSTAGL
jgi:hypothetical protein